MLAPFPVVERLFVGYIELHFCAIVFGIAAWSHPCPFKYQQFHEQDYSQCGSRRYHVVGGKPSVRHVQGDLIHNFVICLDQCWARVRQGGTLCGLKAIVGVDTRIIKGCCG